MKAIKKIVIMAISVATLTACNNNTITAHRGKVKFETIALGSKAPGRISKIYVTEGQVVKKGDTLAYIDIPEVDAKLMQAEGAITAAQGQLNMAKNGATAEQLNQINQQLVSGKAQLNFAQKSFDRMQVMYNDSLVSKQQFDEVNMKLEMAKAQVEAVSAKRDELVKGTRSEQIDQAQGQLDRALGAKQEVTTASAEKYIIAPANMTIETISLNEGELLTPGYALFNGYLKSSVYFRFTIPESEIYDFEVGREITLINPYTEEEYTTKIAAINQLAQYADITSTAPLYKLDEAIYELKLIPAGDVSRNTFYLNASILMKE